jgi:NADH:ubiquinone oxidoreductase subunit 6 (subunit J)
VEEVLFFLSAFGAIGGALAVILVRNPFYSVLSLVVHLFALATLFLLLNAEFIAAAQIVVYAGAVMVLYVFVVAYIGGVEEAGRNEVGGIGMLGAIFATGLLAVATIAIIGSGLTQLDSEGAKVGANFGSPGAIGELLLQKFLVTFETASILLTIAAVGAVVLARKRRGLPDETGQAAESLGPPQQAPESTILGGADADPSRPSSGTAEGPMDPLPDRGTWN